MWKLERNRIILALVLAILAGVFTFILLVKFTSRLPVVVASAPIKKYEIITEDKLKIVYISESDKELLCPLAASNVKELSNSVALEDIRENTPVQLNEMVATGDKAAAIKTREGVVDPDTKIPQNMRVIAVGTDSEGSVNRMIMPGHRVDVVYTSKDESTGGVYSRVILQNVEVFGIQAPDNDAGTSGKQNILLVVEPDKVPILTAAKRSGFIDLLLNPNDANKYDDNPFHISAMAPPRASTKSEIIQYYMNMLQKEGAISEENRTAILFYLQNEKTLDALRDFVLSCNISETVKQQILEILEEDE